VREVVKPMPPKKEMKVWDADQAKTFLKAAAGDRLYALYFLALTTGMRSGEWFGLEGSDVDWSGSIPVQRAVKEIGGKLTLEEVKSAKGRRRIDVPPFVIAVLRDHRRRVEDEGNSCQTVFHDERGGWLQRPNVAQRSFQPLAAKAGVHCTDAQRPSASTTSDTRRPRSCCWEVSTLKSYRRCCGTLREN
jgi:integrase